MRLKIPKFESFFSHLHANVVRVDAVGDFAATLLDALRGFRFENRRRTE
jgi:hypothetical protein